MSGPTFKPGDRVRCIRAGYSVAGKSRLALGETYTVTESRFDGLLDGVNLAEQPLAPGVPLYSASRFELAGAPS